MPGPDMPLVVDTLRHEVRVLATYQPEKFSMSGNAVPNYHLLVSNSGGAAREALFVTQVPDIQLHDAIVSLGGRPGNNLTAAAWDRRFDPDDPAPATRISGTPVAIFISWAGQAAPLALSEVIADPGGNGFDFKFGGNKALIEKWRSGCLVCLYSCPGAKVGNAAYTLRDYASGKTRFQPQAKRLPPAGHVVVLHFRLTPGTE